MSRHERIIAFLEPHLEAQFAKSCKMLGSVDMKLTKQAHCGKGLAKRFVED